jgi:hypothetical protein
MPDTMPVTMPVTARPPVHPTAPAIALAALTKTSCVDEAKRVHGTAGKQTCRRGRSTLVNIPWNLMSFYMGLGIDVAKRFKEVRGSKMMSVWPV